MGKLTDAEAAIDLLDELYWNTGYDGSSASSASINLRDSELPRSAILILSTQNGSGGDTVDVDIQDSADDSNWSDFDTGVTKLNDASDKQTYKLDLEDARQYIRADLASGDQTVGSTIDLAILIVGVGAQQTQSV